jgi:hypothetical protein
MRCMDSITSGQPAKAGRIRSSEQGPQFGQLRSWPSRNCGLIEDKAHWKGTQNVGRQEYWERNPACAMATTGAMTTAGEHHKPTVHMPAGH